MTRRADELGRGLAELEATAQPPLLLLSDGAGSSAQLEAKPCRGVGSHASAGVVPVDETVVATFRSVALG